MDESIYFPDTSRGLARLEREYVSAWGNFRERDYWWFVRKMMTAMANESL